MHLYNSHNRTIPSIIEVIVFLRINREFWNNMDIIKVYYSARDSNLKHRAAEIAQEDEIYTESYHF